MFGTSRFADQLIAGRSSIAHFSAMAAVITAVEGVMSMLKAQRGLVSEDQFATVVRHQAHALCGQISKAELDASSASAVFTLLSDAVWNAGDAEGRRLITDAVNNRLLKGSSSSSRKQCQTMLCPAAFLTQRDIDTMQGAGTVQIKVDCLATRFGRLGITNPTENTIKEAVTLILHTSHINLWDNNHWLVLDFKKAVKAAARLSRGGNYIVHYPSSPAQLDEDLRQHAYDADDPPVGMTIANPRPLNVAMRSTNRANRPSGLPEQAAPNNMASMLTMMMQAFHQQQQQQHHHQAPNLQINPVPYVPVHRPQLMLGNGSPASPPSRHDSASSLHDDVPPQDASPVESPTSQPPLWEKPPSGIETAAMTPAEQVSMVKADMVDAAPVVKKRPGANVNKRPATSAKKYKFHEKPRDGYNGCSKCRYHGCSRCKYD